MNTMLVVCPAKIGDFILAVPALRKLRKDLDEWDITLAVGPEAAPLAARLPYYNRFVELERKGKKLSDANFCLQDNYDAGVLLRYDADYYGAAELVFDRCDKSFTWSAKVTPWKEKRNGLAWDQDFTFILPPDGEVKHEIVRNVELVTEVTGITGQISVHDALPIMKDWAHLQEEHLIVVPGAGEPGKEMADFMVPYFTGYDPIWVGAPEERPHLERLAGMVGGIVYTAPLIHSMGLVAKAKKVVTMDSAMSHVAAAYGRKHMALWRKWDGAPGSPYDPKRFGPWNRSSRWTSDQTRIKDFLKE